MATLEKIRSRAGLLVVVIGLALFAFIIGDFMQSGSTFLRQTHENIAQINGETVNVQDYQARMDDLTEIYKMQYGQANLPEQLSQQITQSTFEEIVTEKLMGEEFDKIGMSLSAEELFDMIQGDNISPMLQQMPMFANPQTGAFDKAALVNFLKNINSPDADQMAPEAKAQLESAKKFWLFWEKNIRQQRLQEKFSALLSKAMAPNSLDAKAQFEGGKTNYDFTYVVQPYTSIADSLVTVAKSDVEKEYNKMKERFKQEEARSIKYLSVEIKPSAEDFAEAEARVNKVREELSEGSQDVDVVNENSDKPYVDAYVAVSSLNEELKGFVATATVNEIYGPILKNELYTVAKVLGKTTGADSAKVNHIMLSAQDEVAANKLADSLLTVLKGGADFAETAAKFSVDQSANNGGEMGWFTESTALRALGEEFKSAIFTNAVNNVFKLKTMYGIHLVKVSEKTAAVEKVKLADIEVAVVPSSKTYSALYNEINALLATNTKVDKLEEAAKEKGFEMIPSTVGATDYALGTLNSGVRPAIRWAFNNKVGSISEIFETTTHFVVVAVTREIAKGYTPLAEVEPMLRMKLVNDKKAEKIIADLKAKNIGSIEGYAEAMGGSVQETKLVDFNTRRISGMGDEPAINGILSSLQKGTVSAPVQGRAGVYVINVTGSQETEKAYDQKAEIDALEAMNAYRIQYQAQQILRDNANIVDERYKFY